MSTQTLVETQETVADFQLTVTCDILSSDDDSASDDCQEVAASQEQDSGAKTVFKEYIPGQCSSDDEKGLVPYVNSDDDTTTSASTNSSIVIEDQPQRHKQPVSESELKSPQGKTFAPATNKKIGWAVKLFVKWQKDRLARGLGGVQIESSDILDPQADVDYLKNTICLFLSEVRRADGKEYPGPSLYNIVVMLQLHFDRQGKTWKLLDDPQFCCIKNTLDNLMKQRSLARITQPVKAAEPITLEDEETLWDMKVLGEDDPEQLRDTVLFLVGLTFVLRGGKEQRALRAPSFDPQIVVKKNEKGVKYLEYNEDYHSKTNQGGIKDRKHVAKSVCAYGHTTQERNVVYLYQKYVALLPENCKNDALYKYSAVAGKRTPQTWYVDKPVGINVLSKVVSNLMARIGRQGKFTNHSLRVSAATRMFNEGIEEQVVKEKTGHRSDAVRAYKRTAEHLLLNAEKAAIGDKPLVRGCFDHDNTPVEMSVIADGKKSGADKLVEVLRHVDSGSSSVKRVKFEVQYHDKK